ncbi:MAG: hypothetical protein WC284_09525 [Candidimonas sp.]
MTTESLTSEQREKLRELFNEGIAVYGDIDSLKEGLKETVKAVAEEMDIKPALINRAMKIAYKNTLNDEKEQFDEVEHLLSVVGRS